MVNDVVELTVRGLVPTQNGVAVFLGNDDKVFVLYVDSHVGQSISMALGGVKRERPLTHDLISSIFAGLGVDLERVVINDVREGTYFARIILRMENELGKKIVEIDARPSDSIVLAVQARRPFYCARAVFDAVDDMTEVLERLLRQQQEEGGKEE